MTKHFLGVNTVTRVFSLPSSALGYLIGYSLVHADHVAICSPWLSDVQLRLPLGCEIDDNRRVRLSTAIAALDTVVDIYVRAGENRHNSYTLSRLASETSVSVIDDLHAKAVVTDEYAYVGSANITRGGLLTNRELCTIIQNQYENVAAFMQAELELSAHDH